MTMRRFWVAAALLLALSLSIAPAVVVAQQAESEWIVVAPAGEGFSIQMPSKPEETTEWLDTEGASYRMRMYTSAPAGKGMIYMAVMQEFPTTVTVLTPAVRLEHFLKGFNEGIAKSMSSAGKVEFQTGRDVNLKDHIGRQYGLSVGDVRGLVRAFDGQQRMYVLLVMGADEKNLSVGHFFDSFQVMPAPAPIPKATPETKPASEIKP